MTRQKTEKALWSWDVGEQDPIADIKALIKRLKDQPARMPRRDAVVASWAYDYVIEHPKHEGCGGEWFALGIHFWCIKCRKPLTRDIVEGVDDDKPDA